MTELAIYCTSWRLLRRFCPTKLSDYQSLVDFLYNASRNDESR
jgi:hypothetical protein